jgi:3-isopropylmalate/(R)-2-methylmalate dehydratase small subunit
MQPFQTFTSTVVALPHEDVDTDQIIPARYLKITDRSGLGSALFADWRYDDAGQPRADFPLNQPDTQGAQVLLAGRNFGCGSSREHAPWALLAYGFRAVISTEFADIFRTNATGNGLLPIVLSPDVHARLLGDVKALQRSQHAPRITVDLAAQSVTLPDGSTHTFPIDPFDRHCLLQGVDRLGFLLELDPEIARFERSHSPAISA